MKTLFIQNKKSKDRGFVVLFAVLISAVVLALTIGISNIAYKELLLSSEAREANYAFFAADSGAECALYADIQQGGFGLPDGTPPTTTFSCNNQTINVASSATTHTFEVSYTNVNGNNKQTCAEVVVEKDRQVTLPDGTTASYTEINSYGYNVSCAQVQALSNQTRAVKRALRVTYQNDVVTP